jgi:uncharacterized protein
MHDVWVWTILLMGSFGAGFIDAVVGGGGLIQVPVLLILFPQYSHVQLIATNRLASIGGTAIAAFQYYKSVGLDYFAVLCTGISAMIFSIIGTQVMPLVNPNLFKPLLFVTIAVLAIYSFYKKELGVAEKPKLPRQTMIFALIAIGIVVGFYNGFIGPGTGTLFVFALVTIARMNFIKATATTKIVNAMADFSSLISFFVSGVILYKLAFPMLIANMAGGYLGSKTAINKGTAFIRVVFLIVMVLLLIRLGYDLFFKAK